MTERAVGGGAGQHGSQERPGNCWLWKPGDGRGTRRGSPSVALRPAAAAGPPGRPLEVRVLWLARATSSEAGPGTQHCLHKPSRRIRSDQSLRPPRRGARVGGRVRVERVVCWALQMLGFERAARHPGDCARHAVIPGLVSKGNITFLDRNLQDPGVWNKSPQMCLGDMWIILR